MHNTKFNHKEFLTKTYHAFKTGPKNVFIGLYLRTPTYGPIFNYTQVQLTIYKKSWPLHRVSKNIDIFLIECKHLSIKLKKMTQDCK